MPRALCRANFFHPCLYCRLCYPSRGTSRSPGTDCRQFLEFKRTPAPVLLNLGAIFPPFPLWRVVGTGAAAPSRLSKRAGAFGLITRVLQSAFARCRGGSSLQKSFRRPIHRFLPWEATINPLSSKSEAEGATPLSLLFPCSDR